MTKLEAFRLYKQVFEAMHGDAKAFEALEKAGFVIVEKSDFFRVAMQLFGIIGSLAEAEELKKVSYEVPPNDEQH